jgi:hypothetical protein
MSPHVCEFTLNVPRWEPSLDDPEKRKIAAELVAEFQKFGYADAKQIVIRDLNLDDPEVTARITGSRDDEEFQGCTFVRQTLPHCTWHLFGQSPRESLRRELMKRPYQIYPRLP